MNFADIWNTSPEDYMLFNKRVLSDSCYFFEQYAVKILITSFWDTQYYTSVNGVKVALDRCSLLLHFFFPKKVEIFYTIRSVYLCVDYILNRNCNFN